MESEQSITTNEPKLSRNNSTSGINKELIKEENRLLWTPSDFEAMDVILHSIQSKNPNLPNEC